MKLLLLILLILKVFGYIKDNKSSSFPIKDDNFQNNNSNCNC